jgi:chorismate synthase
VSGDEAGRLFRVATFGESHGGAVGAVIEGLPAGMRISLKGIQRELSRRRPGRGPTMSARREPDRLEVVSGIKRGTTTGGPIRLQVRNLDARPSDYDSTRWKPRPGHADLSQWLKHGRIPPGGGRASGRETVGRVLAGAVARQVLAGFGVSVAGRIVEVGGKRSGFRRTILDAKRRRDSVGGIVEVVAEGVPPGLGEPVFDRLDADLAKALMSIGAVKGVEVGAGFRAARLRGSEHNDAIIVRKGRLLTRTNNAGGILGGISNGMPVVCRIAVKPTSSIGIEQVTVDLCTMRPARISVRGRHDPCICERIVPVAEAMVAVTLLDHLLRAREGTIRGKGGRRSLEELRRDVRAGDAEMVRLLGKRMELAGEIGRWKRKLGRPVRDAAVERAVLRSAREAAKGAGLPARFVASVMRKVLAESRRRQRAARGAGRR